MAHFYVWIDTDRTVLCTQVKEKRNQPDARYCEGTRIKVNKKTFRAAKRVGRLRNKKLRQGDDGVEDKT